MINFVASALPAFPLPVMCSARPYRLSSGASILIAAGLLSLTACMSKPLPPDQELQAAELAITGAEQQRVAAFSSPDLGMAREKLAAAKRAVQENKMVDAKRLAEQAKVDADLATAKVQVTKASTVNDEMIKSTSSLKQEMQRNTGDMQ